VFKNGSLLNVQFKVGGRILNLVRTVKVVEQVATPRHRFGESDPTCIGSLSKLRNIISHEYPTAKESRPESTSFFVHERDDRNRQLVPCALENTNCVEPSEDTKCAVKPTAMRDCVQVGADDDSRIIACFPMQPQVPRGISCDVEADCGGTARKPIVGRQ
jgi:hypothetical protein